MPQVAAAVGALDAARAAATLREGGEVHVAIGGRDHPLAADDVQMVLQPLDGYQVERSGSHAVALDTVLDDALRREGLAREVVHAVQNARKEAGLEVEDRIALSLGGDDELLAAVRDHEAYVIGRDAGHLARPGRTAPTGARAGSRTASYASASARLSGVRGASDARWPPPATAGGCAPPAPSSARRR